MARRPGPTSASVTAPTSRVTRNLERLLAAKQRLGSELPAVHLVMVVMCQNLHELPELVRLAHRWQVRELFVQHLCHDFGEASLPAHYRPMRAFVQAQTLLGEADERIEHYFSAARRAAQELGVPLRLPRTRPKPHPPGTPGRTRCDWPWRGAYISYQGYAMPCCMVATPDRINFGSMAQDGVIPIWTSAQYEAFRHHLDSEEPPDICRSCALYAGTF